LRRGFKPSSGKGMPRGTEVPLWESRLDHSHDITTTTGMKLLAMLQGAWSTVVRRNPTINNGDWIGYYDGSSTKQARKDTLWEGRGRVIQTGDSPEDSVTTDWYSFDWNSETLIRDPLPNEAWHLDRKYFYKLEKGFNLRNPNRVDSNPEQDTYIVTRVDEDGLKIKRTPRGILLEQYGPAFVKRNQNSQLYAAQMLHSCIPYIKVNT
jgi:hypothetical protein